MKIEASANIVNKKELFNLHTPESPLQIINDPLLRKHNVTLTIKRDDLLHPIIHGNKWRKLKYNLVEANANNINHLLTFGGAFSNHLYAFAAATKLAGFKGTAIVRGPHLDVNNPTLRFVRSCGVNLVAVSRKTYRERSEPEYLQQLAQNYPDALIIPEGGTNSNAIRGVAELAQNLPKHDYLLTPTGSGGTLAGLLQGKTRQEVLGIAVLKNAQYLEEQIKQLSGATSQIWRLLHDFHHGGYGRFSDDLWRFCKKMKSI